MMDLRRGYKLFAALFLALTLAACGTLGALPQDSEDTRLEEQARPPHAGQPGRPPHAGNPGPPPHARRPKAPAAATDWREEVIYFAMTDRFKNGDPANDDGARREGAADEGTTESDNPLGWHGGDFAGLTRAIEEGYFQRMGFTALWLSPVYLQVPAITVNDANSPNDGERFAGYHGYWAEDFFTPDPHFGTLDDYKTLIATAQRHDVKVIQDMVVNHTGYDAILTETHPEWFHTAEDCANAPPAEREKACDLAGLPDFDDRIPEVRDFLNSTVAYWVSLGIDGVRMDTVKHVYDSYWEQYLAPGGPGDPNVVWTVGEVFVGDPSTLAHYLDMGMPSVFDFPLYFRIKDHLSSPGGNLDDVAVVFDWDSAYSDPSRLTTFIDNHDVPRFMSEAASRGVTGDNAAERLDLALSLIYTVRGTPSVYYGTENAMLGRGDPYSFGPFEGNRVKMDFDAPAPLAGRLAALAQARQSYRALTHGVQQELWRPNGREPIMAYRRVLGGHDPVVMVMNNGDEAISLSTLSARTGGIPLLGTFADSAALTEVTGRAHGLSVDNQGRLVGTVPPRTLLAVSAPAGAGEGVNPELENVTDLTALAGDGAVRLSWTPVTDEAAIGYRVYRRQDGQSDTLVNFAPLPVTQTSYTVQGLSNETNYTFTVVTVDGAGRESVGAPTVSATPSASNRATVTFTVDARSQGAGALQLRRFDTGSEIRHPMTATGEQGVWELELELPLLREIVFKFGNSAAGAKNDGYEGPGQGDRRLVIDEAVMMYGGVYDFITREVPDAQVTGTVTGDGEGLTRALVDSSTDASVYYAFTFSDGSYFLPVPSGSVTLTASATGFGDPRSQTVTAPASDVNFAFGFAGGTKYVIDGNLEGWEPRLTLDNPTFGFFGPDNRLLKMLVDWDDHYLYLGYEHRVEANGDNRTIIHIGTSGDGSTTGRFTTGWNHNTDFAQPIHFFLPKFQNQQTQFWRVTGQATAQFESPEGFEAATSGSLPGLTTEVAISWSALGFEGKPQMTMRLYGGIFGGEGFGAGDIIPNPDSEPHGDNSIDTGDSFRVSFNEAFEVSID